MARIASCVLVCCGLAWLTGLSAAPADAADRPTVTILRPPDGSVVRGTKRIGVWARYEAPAGHSIVRVDASLDGRSRVTQAFVPGRSAGELATTLQAPRPGRYTIRVRVTDSAGMTASDTASVEVVGPIEAQPRFKFKRPPIQVVPRFGLRLPWLNGRMPPDMRYWNPTNPPVPRGVPDPERYRFRQFRWPAEVAQGHRYWYPVYPPRPAGTPPGWEPRQDEGMGLGGGLRLPMEMAPPTLYPGDTIRFPPGGATRASGR